MTHDVGPLDAFPEREMRILKVEDREIGVVRLRGRIYAVRNTCPHQAGPLCRGMVIERVVSSAAGTVQVDPNHPVVTCPWHGWEFDLASGRCLADSAKRVATYPAEIRAGRVFVMTEAKPRAIA